MTVRDRGRSEGETLRDKGWSEDDSWGQGLE